MEINFYFLKQYATGSSVISKTEFCENHFQAGQSLILGYVVGVDNV